MPPEPAHILEAAALEHGELDAGPAEELLEDGAQVDDADGADHCGGQGGDLVGGAGQVVAAGGAEIADVGDDRLRAATRQRLK